MIYLLIIHDIIFILTGVIRIDHDRYMYVHIIIAVLCTIIGHIYRGSSLIVHWGIIQDVCYVHVERTLYSIAVT